MPRHSMLHDGDRQRPTCPHVLQVGLKPGLAVGTTAVACFVPGTGVSKAQSFGWCASCGCWVSNIYQLASGPASGSMTNVSCNNAAVQCREFFSTFMLVAAVYAVAIGKPSFGNVG